MVFSKAFIRLRYLDQLPQIRTNMPFEPDIFMDARRGIFALADQFLEASGKRGLVVRAVSALQRVARPFLGRCPVEIVTGLMAAPVRSRLV